MARDVRHLSIWENRQRQKLLRSYISLVYEYYDQYTSRSEWDRDEKIMRPTRDGINRLASRVWAYFREAGLDTGFYCSAPASTAYKKRVDLIHNIFELKALYIPVTALTDRAEMAKGIYEADEKAALIRTLNPLYWVVRAINFVAAIPLEVLISLGILPERSRGSRLGRVLFQTIRLVELFTIFWQAGVFVGFIPADLSLLKVIT